MRKQIFIDGNKRTSMMIANKEMINHGCGIISIPDDKIKSFYELLISFYETNDMKRIKNLSKIRICDKISILRGNINFNFSKDMAKYLTDAYIMQYLMELLKVSKSILRVVFPFLSLVSITQLGNNSFIFKIFSETILEVIVFILFNFYHLFL